MSSEEFAERIMKYVAHADYRPQKVRALARTLGIAEAEYGQFRETVKALMKTGRIIMGSKHALTLPDMPGQIVGTYRANPRGFGFVVPESPTAHGDLFIPPGSSLDAITGDTVRAKVAKRGKRDGKMIYEGRISDVLARGNNRFVGELKKEFNRWFVMPDGNVLHVPIYVADVGAKTAKAGDQVVVEIIAYPRVGREAEGVIIEVLGRRGDPGVDMLSIIRQFHLPDEFGEEVLDDARRAATSYDPDQAFEGREDFSGKTIVTIDPDDARDFDDAISVEEQKDGTFELGVYIADVSNFVLPDGDLDKEARERGNSAYFPGFVIPMLPEVLSNGVCSLQEGVPRLAKAALIRCDKQGKVLGTRFANGVIQSAKRLTYKQATQILGGKVGGYPPEVVDLVQRMDRLARIIQRRRREEGMLTLGIPEVELVLDDDGEVTGVEKADTSFSHTIIEMFMVEANEAVARLLNKLNAPCLRRIHPDPDPMAMESLARFIRVFGYKLPKDPDRAQLQKLLDDVKDKPEAFAVNIGVLRSMQQAVYSPRLVGHFALASEHYAHFTSPIRRYPDLQVHRMLHEYLEGRLKQGKSSKALVEGPELQELGRHCSFTERRAESAERELKTVKLLRLLEARIGETVSGVVTGTTNFGVFVQLEEFLIEGLIRFEDMGDDWWELNAGGYVVGERTGRRITIGDGATVRIARVDIATRQLDLQLAELQPLQARSKKPASKSPKTKAKAKTKPSGTQKPRRKRR